MSAAAAASVSSALASVLGMPSVTADNNCDDDDDTMESGDQPLPSSSSSSSYFFHPLDVQKHMEHITEAMTKVGSRSALEQHGFVSDIEIEMRFRPGLNHTFTVQDMADLTEWLEKHEHAVRDPEVLSVDYISSSDVRRRITYDEHGGVAKDAYVIKRVLGNPMTHEWAQTHRSVMTELTDDSGGTTTKRKRSRYGGGDGNRYGGAIKTTISRETRVAPASMGKVVLVRIKRRVSLDTQNGWRLDMTLVKSGPTLELAKHNAPVIEIEAEAYGSWTESSNELGQKALHELVSAVEQLPSSQIMHFA